MTAAVTAVAVMAGRSSFEACLGCAGLGQPGATSIFGIRHSAFRLRQGYGGQVGVERVPYGLPIPSFFMRK